MIKQEKVKKQVRENVYKYFRNISTSELKHCLLKWRARVELEKLIEDKYKS